MGTLSRGTNSASFFFFQPPYSIGVRSNPIASRTAKTLWSFAKTLWSFGHSESNRVKMKIC